MLYKVGICGYYAEGLRDYGGQPVKTRVLISELTKIYGINNIKTVDTLNWKKRFLNLIYKCFRLSQLCENIIILPAAKGIRVIAPMFLFFNIIFKRKLHYVVIGGWLTNLLAENKSLLNKLKKFDGIYVETHYMERELLKLGLNNVRYMPNMKNLKAIDPYEIKNVNEPVKSFCTFSRIVEGKGIDDAIKAIVLINNEAGFIKCRLDIYGHIYDNYKDEFNKILENAPAYITYKGLAHPDESVEILKKYYMQLFPTKYRTEGVPGSIIDSYFAGLPIIASKWDSYNDVVDDGITGFSYEFNNFDDFVKKIKWCIDNPETIYNMKKECINKSKNFGTEKVISEFIMNL